MPQITFQSEGICPICEYQVTFVSRLPSLRSGLRCPQCNSVPRERALLFAIKQFYPHWRKLAIHESSPSPGMPASEKLRTGCSNYVASQFVAGLEPGTEITRGSHTYRIENLERQTFPDGVFGLVITQDVFEHIMRPDLAIREIARTLRPGGAHVCTIPLVQQNWPSRRRAVERNGGIEHMLPPEYHGNPVGGGALVTVDWGFDVAAYLQAMSGLSTLILQTNDPSLGICGPLSEVVICLKHSVPQI